MTIPLFEYLAPGTLSEVFSAIKRPNTQLLVGDQAYVGWLKNGQASADLVVSLKNIAECSQVALEGDKLTLGTTTRYADLKAHAGLSAFPLLQQALSVVGDPHLLNNSTIGGALYHGTVHHSPVAGALLALDAELVLASADTHQRTLSLDAFYQQGGPASLQSGELIRAVGISPATGASSAYEEIKILEGSRPLCGLAVVVTQNDGKVDSARIVLTRCVTVPLRLTHVEDALLGKPISAEHIEKAQAKLSETSFDLADDLLVQEVYLRHLIKILLKKTLSKL
jgi:aerobic carbon-monoxide dehydrogenase medium subunit